MSQSTGTFLEDISLIIYITIWQINAQEEQRVKWSEEVIKADKFEKRSLPRMFCKNLNRNWSTKK